MSRWDRFVGTWRGENGFRLMPFDDLHVAAATASGATAAAGADLVLRYTWVHAEDGPQDGVLLVGSPDEGRLTAAWGDSWHQQPRLLSFAGTATADGFDLTADYGGGWLWTISATAVDEHLALTMHNVIPAEHATAEAAAGPYPVMVAELVAG